MLLLNSHHRRTSGQESLHLSQIFTLIGWMYLVLELMADMCGDFEFTPKQKRRGGEWGRRRSRKGGREDVEEQSRKQSCRQRHSCLKVNVSLVMGPCCLILQEF